MDPTTLRDELDARGLNQAQFSRAVCVSSGAVSMWLSGARPIPGWVAVALRAIKPKKGGKE